MADKSVVIAEFDDPLRAHIDAHRLAEAGIPSSISNSEPDPALDTGMVRVRLEVRESDVQRARDLLAGGPGPLAEDAIEAARVAEEETGDAGMPTRLDRDLHPLGGGPVDDDAWTWGDVFGIALIILFLWSLAWPFER